MPDSEDLTAQELEVLEAVAEAHGTAVDYYRDGLSAYLHDIEAFLDGVQVGVYNERLLKLARRVWRLTRTWRENIVRGHSEGREGGNEYG